MTTNQARAAILAAALRAGVAGDRGALQDLYTDDVRTWSPAVSTASLSELIAELDRRDDAFDVNDLTVSSLDVGGDYACAEWSATLTHTGPLVVADDLTVDATGTHITVHGVTVAEFDGDRICSLRQYWDTIAVLEQLGVVPDAGRARGQ
jgi:ketosteroid isomerase-like protein